MQVNINKPVYSGFTIANPEDQFGQALDASFTPIGTLYKNGVVTEVAVTITKPATTTGRYFASFTPESTDFSVYDWVTVIVVALLDMDKPVQLFTKEFYLVPENCFNLYVEPIEGTVRAEVEGMASAIELAALEDKVDAAIAAVAALDTKFDTQPVIVTGLGDGSVAVNHNYGGADVLRVLLDGIPFDNAHIQAYLKSDYDAHNLETAYVKGRSKTNVEGRWEWPVMLDPGIYTLVFFKQGFFVPQPFEITVT